MLDTSQDDPPVIDAPPTYAVYENLIHSAAAAGLDQAWVDAKLAAQRAHILDATTMIGFSWSARNAVLDEITKVADQQREAKAAADAEAKKAAAKAERAAKKAAKLAAAQEAADSAEQTAENRATLELHVLNEKDRILAKHDDTAWLEHVWNVAEREHGITWKCLEEFKRVLEGGKDGGDDTRAVPEAQGAPDQSAPEVGNDGSDQDQKPEKTPKERLADLYLLASEEKIPTTQVNQWWDQITGGHLSIFGDAELSKLDELIYLERMKNRKPATATTEENVTRTDAGHLVDEWGEVIDVPQILKDFDLAEMPTLDDPNIFDIVDRIGDKIAEHQEAAARYIKNAEAKGAPRLRKAAQIEQVFGHLIYADAIRRLPKFQRDCKGGKAGEPSKKSYIYPSFVVSFTKSGGLHVSNKRALDTHLTAMPDDELEALGLRKREIIDNEWDQIKELIKDQKLPADMPGVVDLPVDHYAKRTIKPTKGE